MVVLVVVVVGVGTVVGVCVVVEEARGVVIFASVWCAARNASQNGGPCSPQSIAPPFPFAVARRFDTLWGAWWPSGAQRGGLVSCSAHAVCLAPW